MNRAITKLFIVVVTAGCLVVGFLVTQVNAQTSELWRTGGIKIVSLDQDFTLPQKSNNYTYSENVHVISPDAPNGKRASGYIYQIGDSQWLWSDEYPYQEYIKRAGDTVFRRVVGDGGSEYLWGDYCVPDATGLSSESNSFVYYCTTDIIDPADKDLHYFGVYPDFNRALVEVKNGDGMVTSLILDKSYRRLLLPRNNTNMGYPITNRKYSNNGKYMLATIEYRDLVKINLVTQEAYIIDKNKLGNGQSFMPGAISNDGAIAISDTNTTIYDTTNCGDLFTDGWLDMAQQNKCKKYTLGQRVFEETGGAYYGGVRTYVDNESVAYLTYEDDNLDKGFKVKLEGLNNMKLPVLEYLALGDSYSSGEGDIGRKADGSRYYLSNSNTVFDNCHISTRSYPYLLRDKWKVSNDSMRSVACSGARVVADYMRYEDGYEGQDDRLMGLNDMSKRQDDALSNFHPGYVQQVDFVKEYRPKIITLTGGGNDIGFARILKYCASPQFSDFIPFTNRTCGYAQTGSSLNKILNKSIDAQYKPLKEFVDEVYKVSPDTQVILVGYPSPIAEYNGVACMPNSGVLDIDEMRMINNSTKRLNEVIKKVAHDTDSSYVDIYDSLNGGRICEGSEYVTGVWSYTTGQAVMEEQFHPNSSGHKKIADSIYESKVYDSKSVPSSDYTVQQFTITQQTQLLKNDASIYRYSESALATGSGALMAGSQYNLTVYSDTINLGTFTAQPDGSASASVSLANVPIGDHVLVLEGVAPDGSTATYYQFIQVRYSPDDADGDGVKDVDDNCDFITYWYDESIGKDVCSITKDKLIADEGDIVSLRQLSIQTQDTLVTNSLLDNGEKGMFTYGEPNKLDTPPLNHLHVESDTKNSPDTIVTKSIVIIFAVITISSIIGYILWRKMIK